MLNKDYSMNKYTDPAKTHPDIILDVPIPHEWESHSYKNDVCPSFAYKGLQIFICDEKTKKLEGLHFKYIVMFEEDYGYGYDSLLNSDDWNEVLDYVNNHQPFKNIEQRITKDHLDFTLAQIFIDKFQQDDEPAKYINSLAEKYINADQKYFDLEAEHFKQIVNFVCTSLCGYEMESILKTAEQSLRKNKERQNVK